MNNEKHIKEFKLRMMHILVAFTRINPKIGYVQGMNVVVAHLLYHVCQEDYSKLKISAEITFFIFWAMMNNLHIDKCFE